jgi:DNA end-binding protein Ku
MARALWRGAISFGLVNVPVRLYPATQPKEVHFHLLHDADGARIQEKRICSKDGDEVPWAHVIKGYELRKGAMVPVTPEELERFAPEITHTIDIEQFVDLGEVDPLYYQRSYYLGPERGSAKVYALLLAALEDSAKIAVARVVLRSRQSLCAIRPIGGALLLSTMQYPDEIRALSDIEGLPIHTARPAARELNLARQLIESLEAPFEPSRLHDQYRAKLLRFLDSRAKGKTLPAEPVAPAPKLSLVEALSHSIERKRRDAGGSGRRRKKRVVRHRRTSRK